MEAYMEPTELAAFQRSLSAGDRLRRLRTRLGITTREIESLSRRVAEKEGNEGFIVSHARITQIENNLSTPSLFKLFSLSTIYGIAVSELMSFYIDPQSMMRHHMSLNTERTHLVSLEEMDANAGIEFPIRFDPGFTAEKTNLVSRMVEVWGEVPVGLLRQLKLRHSRYAFIGLNDYTMYPLLRPGSFVQIDNRSRLLPMASVRTELDRPIYFIELRDGYVCSWCEVHGKRLLAIPHPLSGCQTQEFAYPDEAEIIGRVTAVAARLVPLPDPKPCPNDDGSGSPEQS
jgi:transcriptional regulator with XRE-family HTH domain